MVVKRRILYVHHSGGMGGAPRSLAFLIKRLDKSIYEPIVICLWGGPAVKLFEEAGATVIVDTKLKPFHGTTVSGMNIKIFLKGIIYAYPTYLRAKKVIKELQPDLIHLNTTCLFMLAKAAKKVSSNLKVITHVREPLLDSLSGKILKYMNHKYVDGYIAIDKYDASKLNIKDRIAKVVYNFVDFDEYNSEVKSNVLRKELNISEDSIIFLYLARIAQSNGTLEMVRKCKEIVNNKKNYHFVIVGDVPEESNEYTIKVRGICDTNSNIHLLKFRNDIPNVIASSDIMLCPFTKPHFSRAIIEAAAMGKPAIGSNVGGPAELIVHKETGLLFDVNNFDTMLDCINKMASDNEYIKYLGKNAEKFAYDNFNMEKNSKETFKVYDDLLNN
jgi:glycosyltransferase involved in cell wall biosynthesis